MFGETIRISNFSSSLSKYWVKLVRLPYDTTDQTIFDWVIRRDCTPWLIHLIATSGKIASAHTAVYFTTDPLSEWLLENGQPVQEIRFPNENAQGQFHVACKFIHKYAVNSPPVLLFFQELYITHKPLYNLRPSTVLLYLLSDLNVY